MKANSADNERSAGNLENILAKLEDVLADLDLIGQHLPAAYLCQAIDCIKEEIGL